MWSIGIYTGDSPFDLREAQGSKNPVLTPADVTDISAAFVADPFMIRKDELWHMFFEVMNDQTGRGEIGWASSEDGHQWSYQQIVLNEPFHLSYPCVFEWNEAYLMIPETLAAASVCLYRAEEFPIRWSLVSRLFDGNLADPSIFRFDRRWWMFTCSTPYQHDTLRLFFGENLSGPWQEHPASPIISGDKRRARPGGRVLSWEGRLIRFAQDCFPHYGSQLRAFEILELSDTAYVEKELENSPLMSAARNGWNAFGMHHIDVQQDPKGGFIACIDGRGADL